jgi:hypothetical protein
MRKQWRRFVLALAILLSAVAIPVQKMNMAESPHKIYVTLGFHTSFYHSWRGDTPDEAGFGTDIRLVRAILDILNEANQQGLDARGYWDFDVYWTLEKIIPAYAPDLIDGIRPGLKRVRMRLWPGLITTAPTMPLRQMSCEWHSSTR